MLAIATRSGAGPPAVSGTRGGRTEATSTRRVMLMRVLSGSSPHPAATRAVASTSSDTGNLVLRARPSRTVWSTDFPPALENRVEAGLSDLAPVSPLSGSRGKEHGGSALAVLGPPSLNQRTSSFRVPVAVPHEALRHTLTSERACNAALDPPARRRKLRHYRPCTDVAGGLRPPAERSSCGSWPRSRPLCGRRSGVSPPRSRWPLRDPRSPSGGVSCAQGRPGTARSRCRTR